MRSLCILGLCLLISFAVHAQPTQQEIDNPSSENINKLVGQIKALLEKYPTALSVYKGAEIKDTSVTDSKWFRSSKPFALATKSVIELEDGGHELYLSFEGFSKNFFAIGFGKKLKNKLLEANYSFGQLKEEASGEDGLLHLVLKNDPADKKFTGISIFIHLPDPGGLEDKFGKKRMTDVVVRIYLPPGK